MKTSSWRLYQGPGRVSISRFAPRAAPAGYAVCRRLVLARHRHRGTPRPEHQRDLIGICSLLLPSLQLALRRLARA